MLADANLIKVKAMSRSMAKQVTVCLYNDSVGKQIVDGFRKDLIRPIAWACGDMLDGIPDGSRAWLVSFEGNYYWILAPYKGVSNPGDGTPEWMAVCCKNLPQVFIG